MYYYVIESEKKGEFEKVEGKIKEILTNFDILGEFIFIENMADSEDIVKQAVKKGFSTIVAVGGDNLANKLAVNLINTKMALGILPLEEGILATALGLGNWKAACEILAARRILLMDTGIVNEKSFVTEILASSSPDIPPKLKPKSLFSKLIPQKSSPQTEKNLVKIDVDDEFSISSEITGLVVSNLRPYGKDVESIRQSMIDQNLHLAFSDQTESTEVYLSLNDGPKIIESNNVSLFHLKSFSINSEKPLFFWSSGDVIARTPASLEILPQSLKIIGGRLR